MDLKSIFMGPNKLDFNTGVKMYLEQIDLVSNVLRSGKISSQSDYTIVRDQRNMFRDMYNDAHGWLNSEVIKEKVKQLDSLLDLYEKENPESFKAFHPVFSLSQ